MGASGQTRPALTHAAEMWPLLLLLAFPPAQCAEATPCQQAILRCCSPSLPASNSTWRCFEKNDCSGLFVVTTNKTSPNNKRFGACAYFSEVLESLEDTIEGLGIKTPESKDDRTDVTTDKTANTENSFSQEVGTKITEPEDVIANEITDEKD